MPRRLAVGICTTGLFYYRTAEEMELQMLSEPKADVWTRIETPTDDELAKAIDLYNLDKTIVEDIHDVFEVLRFEQEGITAYFFRHNCRI